jgi:hypothetical protein
MPESERNQHHTAMHTIHIPAELRQRILYDKARLQGHRDGEGHAATALQSEIKTLEETQAALIQRIATLTFQAVHSDTAAGQLSNVERRAAAIRTRLDQLRASPLPAIDLEATFGVLFFIVFFYQDAVKNLLLGDLEAWEIDVNSARILFAQVPALAAVRNISTWLSTATAPHTNHLARINVIYERVLRGQVDLSRHENNQPDPSLP